MVAEAVALSRHKYHDISILAEYARVKVTWIHLEHVDDEINIETPDRTKYMQSCIGKEILWPWADIFLTRSFFCHRPCRLPWIMTDDDNGNDPAGTPPSMSNP